MRSHAERGNEIRCILAQASRRGDDRSLARYEPSEPPRSGTSVYPPRTFRSSAGRRLRFAAQHCIILRMLAKVVVPRWRRSGRPGLRQYGIWSGTCWNSRRSRQTCRSKLTAVWQVFGEAQVHSSDANVQASCFALAEATAWLKAADSTLGRIALARRMSQTEEREDLHRNRSLVAACCATAMQSSEIVSFASMRIWHRCGTAVLPPTFAPRILSVSAVGETDFPV